MKGQDSSMKGAPLCAIFEVNYCKAKTKNLIISKWRVLEACKELGIFIFIKLFRSKNMPLTLL